MRAITIAVLLFFCQVGFARGKIQGFCEAGNNTVATQGLNSTTKVQRSYPSCTVTVYIQGTATLATIYSDMTGTSLASSFTANADGTFGFFSDYRVDVAFSGGGISTPFTKYDLAPQERGTTVDCSSFPGANAGAKITACITALPSGGGVADARGIQGSQTTTGFTVGSATKRVTLLLGNITLVTSGQIVFGGPSVFIIGIGRDSTIIQMNAAFAANTPMIQFDTTQNQAQRLENLQLDCNTVTNSICVDFGAAQEQSGLYQVTVYRYTKYGVSVPATSQTWLIEDCEFFPAIGSVAAKSIYLVSTGGTIRRTSVVPQSGTGFAVGIDAVSSTITLESVRVEGHTDAILAEGAGARLNIFGFVGLNNVDCIRFASNVSSSSSVLLGLVMGASTRIVKNDLAVFNHSSTTNEMPWYYYYNEASTPQFNSSDPTLIPILRSARIDLYGQYRSIGTNADMRIGADAFVADVGGIGTATNHPLYFATNGTTKAYIPAAGGFLPFADNTYVVGNSSNRWSGGVFVQLALRAGTNHANGLLLGTTTQGALGTPDNGTIIYCSDCTIASPCAGGGTGAVAKRIAGAWICN